MSTCKALANITRTVAAMAQGFARAMDPDTTVITVCVKGPNRHVCSDLRPEVTRRALADVLASIETQEVIKKAKGVV